MHRCYSCHEEPKFSLAGSRICLNCTCGIANDFDIKFSKTEDIFNKQKELENNWNNFIKSYLSKITICSFCHKKYDTKEDAIKCQNLDNANYKYEIGDVIIFFDYNDDHVGYRIGIIVEKVRLNKETQTFNQMEMSVCGDIGYKIQYNLDLYAYIPEDEVYTVKEKYSTELINKNNIIQEFKKESSDFFKKNGFNIKIDNFLNQIHITIEKKQ